MISIDYFVALFDSPRKAGQGYEVRCPCHDDRQQSLSVNTGDDGRLLIKCHAGCQTPDILATVGLKFSDIMPEREVVKPAKQSRGRIVTSYDYVDADGVVLFQVTRWADPKAFTQRKYDAERGWVNNMDGVVRVLYRLPRVRQAISRGDTIFLVEGEKDVHTLEAIGLVATTHPGGASAWKKSPRYGEELKGCTKLIMLPDNDAAGAEMARAIKRDLPHAVVLNLPGLPDKGDVTDWVNAGGTREKLEQLCATIELAEHAAHNALPAPQAGGASITSGRYYRALGYNQRRYYFLPAATMQVAFYSAPELSIRANLYTIAPREHWENSPDFDDCENAKGGKDYSAIADALIQKCIAVGLYSDDMRRGMGAWMDNGRTVLHSGRILSVDGVKTPLVAVESQYIYEARAGAIPVDAKPINADQCASFLELCALPSWESPLLGHLLAGWVACAPICGTLRWRPHIWINGPAGCGKTYIASNLVGRVLSGVIRQFAASTTEAGIRQKLASDALPVLFDEAEGDTRGARDNIGRILELMRHSSSDSDAHITKGSAGGVSTDFAIRSMFCMASIAHGIQRRADESRTTVLSLRAPRAGNGAREQFQRISEGVAGLCSPTFASGMVALSCHNAGLIRDNAETFAQAFAATDKGRRYGDQIGTLLAGYHSLAKPELWTVGDAVDYIEELDISALEPPGGERGSDETQCLDYLMQQVVRLELNGGGVSRSIGEMVLNCQNMSAAACEASGEHLALLRHGIRVADGGCIMVSNTHSTLATIFRDTPYSGQWATYLLRIEGAKREDKAARFAGTVTRYTTVPYAVL